MGLKLTSPGALAPWYTKTIPPVTRALEGWFCFDTSLERIGFNRAPQKGNARMVGQPTVFATHARFKGGVNYLETLIPETAAMTILVVGKVPGPLGGSSTTTAAPYIGTLSGATANPTLPGGIALYHITDATLTGNANRMNAAGDGYTTGQANMTDNPTVWGIRMLRTSSAGGTRVANLTTGGFANQSLATNRLVTTVPLRIGGTYASTFLGETDISHVAIYSDALTDDEVALVAASMRKRMARLGIVI